MIDDIIGYTVCMYNKSGGCIATWKPNLRDALDEIFRSKPHDGIVIVKLPYKDRMNRHVIRRATHLDDSGIYTKTLVTEGSS